MTRTGLVIEMQNDYRTESCGDVLNYCFILKRFAVCTARTFFWRSEKF